jgi:glycosyltransferase involved in cell wall biosynthesis
MNQRVCVFTIVAKNYLHYAINLMSSVAEFMPGARRVVALCDRPDGVQLDTLPFEVIELESIEVPHLDRLLFQYTILELNTAIKPFVFSHLFRQGQSDKVVYFDPDIQLFSSGKPLLDALDDSEILLTPHLSDFLDDDRHPSDLSILQSGTYNLGFVALKRSAATEKLLAWWQGKLLRDCVVDIPRGLFTDQKWMDLVPGIFECTNIVRHPGWNVAYWNLKHRRIDEQDGRFLVNGQTLFFFHFSGFDAEQESISKHQNRFRLGDLAPATRHLFEIYERNVEACGRARYEALPYAYAALQSGLRLPVAARTALRCELDWNAALPDFRTSEGERFIVDFLNAPVDKRQPAITRLAMTLYKLRPDLQSAFPDVLGTHRAAFTSWFCESAKKEAHLEEVFLAPMAGETARRELVREEQVMPPGVPGYPIPNRSLHSLAYRALYRLAWWARALYQPVISSGLRHRVRVYLLRKAHAGASSAPRAAPVGSGGAPAAAEGDGAHGLNVIGYVRAESGVGESARSTLRALKAAGVEHSIVDYRLGNVSRMDETVDETKLNGLRFGVSLFHINADQLALARDALGEEFFGRKYRIGYWAWELGRFPDRWLSAFSCLHEVWVPSTFCQRAIAAKSPVPVVCIPHTVEIVTPGARDRRRFGLREDSIVFLTMADVLSVPERKNTLGAVEAFMRAFKGRETAVQLVLKLSNPGKRPDIMEALRAYAAECPGILLIDRYLSREDVSALIDTVDCFVSLHRSEGFGLGIAEAMVREKAVIATGWSGNMDFTNVGNALVVDYKLIELDRDYGPYAKGEVWADPSIDDAAAKMRAIFESADLRARLGRRARADCIRLLSPEVIGRATQERLERIYSFPDR